MSFSIGDRVRITTDTLEGYRVPRGTCGTVNQNNDTCPWVIWEGGGIWCVEERELELITEGESMPLEATRALRPGDKVRLEQGSYGYIHTFTGVGTVRERAYTGEGWQVTWPDGSRTDYFKQEHLVLVEPGPSIEPKYSAGDKLLYDRDIAVEVLEWKEDTEEYRVQQLNNPRRYRFNTREGSLYPLSEKALAKRLEKAGMV